MAKSKLLDLSLYAMAGIDPKTGLPTRRMGGDLKKEIRALLRIMDEQDAVNRYRWINLPCNITSQELERMLYYKGQLAFFYIKEVKQFYFMPYALDGTIDLYGRYNSIHPIPFTQGVEQADGTKKATPQAEFLSTLKRKCVYGVLNEDEVNEDTVNNSAVLLHDYTKQLSQSIIPRYTINEPLIDLMSDCMPMMRTNLLIGSGIKGMRVTTADAKDEVYEANRTLYSACLRGEAWIPITGTTEFQDLANQSSTKAEEYMIAMQSIDNLRKSTYGIDNGGLFEKKAHMLESENDVNNTNSKLTYNDGLDIRQHFCDVVNSIFNLGIWCESTQEEAEDSDYLEPQDNKEVQENEETDL